MAYVFKELAIADFNELMNKPIINADLDNTSAANADLTVLYHHVGSSTETYKKTVLYYSDGTAWCEFKGTPGKDGKDGKDGPPGADGKDGKDGSPGKDGAPGADGKDGVSVVSAQLTKIE